jgi:transposase
MMHIDNDTKILIERKILVLEPQGVNVSAMKCIGEMVNRRLQHIPASFILIETIRPKYKDPVTGLIYQALPQTKPLPKAVWMNGETLIAIIKIKL